MKPIPYPEEFLNSKVYIIPTKMRKSEVAIFLDTEWEILRREIFKDKDLLQRLYNVRYKPNSKTLTPGQVCVLFNEYSPPLAEGEKSILYNNIKKRNFTELRNELKVLGIKIAV